VTSPIGPGPGFQFSPLERVPSVGSSVPAEGPSFGDLLKKGLTDASQMQDDSKDLIARFLRGEPVELHQVMAASEEAGLAVDFLVQVRNKVTDAYRSIMNTSI
jgi:flagellar hook-basal body complex protein FliE